MKNKYLLSVLVLLFILIAIPRIIFPDLDHGDEYSDANALNAGENFVRFGFIKTYFLPMFEPGRDLPSGLYTHCPPLPELINGALRAVFNTDSLVFFRFISLCFSFLNLLFWYLFIKNLTKSGVLTFLSCLLLLINPLFIFGMDSVHQLSYGDCLRSLIFFITILLVNSPGKIKIVLLWIFLLIESWISFEYVPYLGLFFILFNFFIKGQKQALSKKAIFILLLAPVCGFLLHLLQNIWYLGSFSLAYQDLRVVAAERIANSKDAGSMVLNLPSWLKDVVLRNISLTFLFNYYSLFLAAFFSCFLYPLLAKETQKEVKAFLRLSGLLFVCGMSWYIAFPSHSLVHTYLFFLARHLTPAAAVALAILCYIILSFIKERLNFSRFYSGLLVLFILILIFAGIGQSQLPVTSEKVRSSREFIKFKQSLLNLRQISQVKDEVGVNYFRYPFIRYYTHRHTQPFFDKSSLERREALPKYFIFIPYNNQATQELYEFLNLKYLPIFRCDSQRFPSIFFELKQ